MCIYHTNVTSRLSQCVDMKLPQVVELFDVAMLHEPRYPTRLISVHDQIYVQ
jgi:hypothetical protein